MYEMIKEIAERCVQSNLQFGFKVATVKSSNELVLEPGLILPIEPCLVLENVGGISVKINGQEQVLRKKIEIGDKLLLLNIDNTYCVLDRLGNLFDDKTLSYTIPVGSTV